MAWPRGRGGVSWQAVTTLRHIHRFMTERRRVVLSDGTTGRVVRVDTVFPGNETTISVWLDAPSSKSVEVQLSQVVGPVPETTTVAPT